jgi:hypothetical protein
MNKYDNGTLRAADIEGVDIIGKETKHLRVTFVSKEARNRTLVAVKRKKSENLFANEYLTNVRAALLFNLRTLKKPTIPSRECTRGKVKFVLRLSRVLRLPTSIMSVT